MLPNYLWPRYHLRKYGGAAYRDGKIIKEDEWGDSDPPTRNTYIEGDAPDHNKQLEGEAHSAGGTNAKEEEKKKLHDELCTLVNKYKEMARKMGGSSSIDQLLNRTNLLTL